MPRKTPSSSEMVLMALVARRYYLARQSKIQIAQDLDISRFRVARLLDAAADQEIVRFEVGLPGDIDLGLSAELRELFGITHCIIVDTPDEDPGTLRRYVGLTTTQLLSEIVGPDDTLGLSSTRVLMGLTEPVGQFATCPVVQIAGALSRPDASDVMEAVRRFSRAGGGAAYVFYAPLICRDIESFHTFLRQPDVERCYEMFAEVTVSITGMGVWQPGLSTVYDAVSDTDRQVCRQLGVTAEVAGILVDQGGTSVQSPLSERIICMSEAQLRSVPTRIGVAFERGKAPAVASALRGGLINALVTHRSLALEVLNIGGRLTNATQRSHDVR